jgi:chromosomal replication initiator protein
MIQKSAYTIPGIIKPLQDQIAEKIIKFTGQDITIKSRKREIVWARQLAMFILRKKTKMSLSKIGELCGNKDHATVLHACKSISNLIETDSYFRKKYNEILQFYCFI